MPFDGSGGFVPISAPDFPAVPATLIRSDQWNNVNYDIFAGFSNCVTRDGQSPPTADLPAGGFKITNLGAPSVTGDSLSWGRPALISTFSASGDASFTGALTLPTGATYARVGLISTNPGFSLFNSTGSVDEKAWQMFATSGSFIARVVNDANNVATNWLGVARTGTTVTAITLTATALNVGANTAITGTLGVSGGITGNVTGNISGSSGSTTGNAATATILATARAINGVNFNGSAAITVPVNAAAITTNANFSVPFLSAATGNANVQTDPGLVYNPNTNVLTAASSNVVATAVGTNAAFAVPFMSTAAGSATVSTDSTGLNFNPSSNLLTTGGLQVGGTALGNVYAARYTAATSANVNIGTLTVQGNWLYHRIGNYVTVYGAVVVQPTSTGAFGFQVSLPVASDIGATTDLYGTGSVSLATSSGALIFGNVANNTAQFSCDSGTGTPSNTLSFTFSYQVI